MTNPLPFDIEAAKRLVARYRPTQLTNSLEYQETVSGVFNMFPAALDELERARKEVERLKARVEDLEDSIGSAMGHIEDRQANGAMMTLKAALSPEAAK